MIQSGIATLVALLAMAAVTAVLVQRIPIPYVVALAVIGAVVGQFLSAQPIRLTHSVILFILLPGLLFEAAFNLKWSHLRDNLVAVLALATLGVFLTTALAGLLVHYALGLTLAAAVVFGAIIAPTDPVAVVAVFRRLGAPSRLTNLVEGESLLNDGTGVVVFSIALGLVGVAGGFDWLTASWQFVRLSVGGAGFGLALGLALSLLTRRIDDPQVEITFTVLAAYGGYLLAELAGVSGILAVVGAGLVMGNYGRPRGMSERTQVAVVTFWDYITFLLNSVIFLLIGLDLPAASLFAHLGLVVGAFGIATLARAIAVYGLLALLRPLGRAVNLRWQTIIVWSGLRGAIATALLLSLPQGPAELALIAPVAYGVVLLSIVVQGATIGPLTRWMLPHSREHPAAADATA